MSSKATGIIFAVLIVVASGFFLSYELNVPQVNSFSFPPVPSNATRFADITLYAEQPGWDYNLGSSHANPTLVFQVGTVVNFTIIEADTLIHNLAINPGTSEASNATIVASIAPPTGSVQKAQVYFYSTGIYTYWCTVHPTTMVGLIYVNKTVSSVYSLPPLPSGYPVNYSQTLTIGSSSITNSSGGINPSLYYPTGSAVNFTIVQGTTANSSFNIAPGSAESSFNETAVNSTVLTNVKGTSAGFVAYFRDAGVYTYWDAYNPLKTEGHIYIADYQKTVLLNVTPAGIALNGSLHFGIPVMNSSNVEFMISDSGSIGYNISISGNGLQWAYMNGSADTIFNYSFQSPVLAAISTTNPVVSSNSIFVFVTEVNVTLNATLSGFVFSGLTNPNLYFTQYTLVNFTLTNSDNLNNTLVINAGTSENQSGYTTVASVTAGNTSSRGYYFFAYSGNYTVWNTYHPLADVLLAQVSAYNAAASQFYVSQKGGALSSMSSLFMAGTACGSKKY